VVTGVSGSGKSTLMQDVLVPALNRHFGQATETPAARPPAGRRPAADVVFVDQSPIGKTARSNPASYVGAWDEIRKLFAVAPLAQERYTAGMFSFNAGDGRCPTCGGSGFEHVEMQFLSDVYLRCPDCDGTLPRRDPGREDRAGRPQPVHRRRAGADRQRGGAVLCRRPRGGGRCSPSSTWAWTTCAWASRCPRCRAARPSA
jgi:excinuclease ABC subunit A